MLAGYGVAQKVRSATFRPLAPNPHPISQCRRRAPQAALLMVVLTGEGGFAESHARLLGFMALILLLEYVAGTG